MEEIEKNDVDISSIFNWGRVFEVTSYSSDEPEALVYMRLLGDADVNRSRVYALRKSAELRKKLKTEGSDERLAFISDIEDLSEDNMLGFILALSTREVMNKVRDSVKVKEPKAPKSTAKLEEMEKYQKDVDDYPKKLHEARKKAIEEETNKLRKSLEGISKEELYKQYVTLLITELCEKEAMDAFREIQVYLGCYKDSSYKERFFSSIDEFQNLQPEMKKRFMDAYASLDIEINELKKLRRATQ